MYNVQSSHSVKHPNILPPTTRVYNKGDLISCQHVMEGIPKTVRLVSSLQKANQGTEKAPPLSNISAASLNIPSSDNGSPEPVNMQGSYAQHSPCPVPENIYGSRYYAKTETVIDIEERPVSTALEVKSISPTPVMPNEEIYITENDMVGGIPYEKTATDVSMDASTEASKNLVIEYSADVHHEPISITVFSGNMCLTPVYSLVSVVVRISFDRIEFKGELYTGKENEGVTNRENLRESSASISQSPNLIEGQQTSNPSQYSLLFEEIDFIDILGDRVSLLCGSGQGSTQCGSVKQNQYPLKSVSVYCHDSTTLAASIGKVVNKMCRDYKGYLKNVSLKKKKELEAIEASKSAQSKLMQGLQMRYDPSPLWGEPLKTEKPKEDIHPYSTLPIPPTYHSSSGLLRRNYAEAANDFKYLYEMLEGGKSITSTHLDGTPTCINSAVFQSTNEDCTDPNVNIGGEYCSDDVTRGSVPPKRDKCDSKGWGYDPTTTGRDIHTQQLRHLISIGGEPKCDYLTNNMNELHPLVASPLCGDYRSYYPTLRSPYVSHASPSHPYQFMAQQKASQALYNSQLIEKVHQAEEKEAASRRKMELLEEDLKHMKEQMDTLKLVQEAMVRPSRSGLNATLDMSRSATLHSLVGDCILDSRPIIDFDDILDPTIDSKVLRGNNDISSISNKSRVSAANSLGVHTSSTKYGREGFIGTSMMLPRRGSVFSKGQANQMRSITQRRTKTVSNNGDDGSLSTSDSSVERLTNDKKPFFAFPTSQGSDSPTHNPTEAYTSDQESVTEKRRTSSFRRMRDSSLQSGSEVFTPRRQSKYFDRSSFCLPSQRGATTDSEKAFDTQDGSQPPPNLPPPPPPMKRPPSKKVPPPPPPLHSKT